MWKIQRDILAPKRDEVTGECRRLHDEKLHDLTSSQNYSGDQFENNEMGGACRPYEGKKRAIHHLVGKKNVRERDHLGDLGVDGRTILKWIFKMSDVGMDWINLTRDRDRWWALVKEVMNLQVTQNAQDFLTS